MIQYWFRRRRYLRFTRHVAGAIRRRLVRVLTLLAALLGLHTAGMMAFEGLVFGDAVWLTVTTATTVGYGDLHADTFFGRATTVACMYTFGIFLLAQAASDLFDYRALLRERRRRGEYRWKKMHDHLLIINVPVRDAEHYLEHLVAQVRQTPKLGDIPIQVLTPNYRDGLPDELVDAGVTHYTGVAESSASVAAANAHSARFILIIADEGYDPRSDSHTFDVLTRIRDLPEPAHPERVVVAEVVDDANRARILAAGASTTVRPVRAYPELAVRALASPGVERVLETLFTHGADRLARFDVAFDNVRWADVLSNFVQADAGVPMGYIGAEGVNTNPPPGAMCSGEAIIALIDESLEVTTADVASCLEAARGTA